MLHMMIGVKLLKQVIKIREIYQVKHALSEMWSMCVKLKKNWLYCIDKSERKSLRQNFCKKRKHFDREVQRAKRPHWFSLQNSCQQNVILTKENI